MLVLVTYNVSTLDSDGTRFTEMAKTCVNYDKGSEIFLNAMSSHQ
jgi:hypothetical protein